MLFKMGFFADKRFAVVREFYLLIEYD